MMPELSRALRHVPLLAVSVYIVLLLALPSDVGFDVGPFLLTPARLALVVAIVVVVSAWLRIPRMPPAGIRLVLVAWAAFLASAGVSVVLVSSSEAIARFGSLVVEGPAVLLVVWWVSSRPDDDRFLESVLLLTTLAVAAAGLVLAVLGLRYDEVIRSLAGGVVEPAPVRFGLVRQQGAFDAALYWACWTVGVSALLVGRLLVAEPRWRPAWLAATALLATGVISTLSRLAIAALPAVAAAVFASARRWSLALAGLGLSLVLVLAMASAPSWVRGPSASPAPSPTSGPAPPSPAPSPTLDPGADLEGSNQARIEALKAALEAAGERPLFGWGLLSARDIAADKLGRPNWVDSAYLVILIEMGSVGLATFVVLTAAVLLPGLRRLDDLLTSARVVALASMLAFSLLLAFFAATQAYAAFWVVSGIMLGRALRERAPTT